MVSQAPQFPQDVREGFVGANPRVGWPKRFISFGVLVFALVFITYLGLSLGYQTYLDRQISGARGQLDALSRQITEEEREDLSTLYSQVANIRALLADHTLASQVFDTLEAITAPQVVYTNFELSIPDRQARVNGVAATYEELVAQLALFEGSNAIERFSLENSELEGSVVRFTATITFTEEVLKAQ